LIVGDSVAGGKLIGGGQRDHRGNFLRQQRSFAKGRGALIMEGPVRPTLKIPLTPKFMISCLPPDNLVSKKEETFFTLSQVAPGNENECQAQLGGQKGRSQA
jgi:hypothetical protein